MTKVSHLRHITMSLTILLTMLVLTACGSSTGNDTSEEKETSSVWDKISEKGEMIVATSGTLYPASFHDSEANELTGYEVEIMREIGKRLELDIKFVEMGLDGMLTSLNSGQVDLAVNDI